MGLPSHPEDDDTPREQEPATIGSRAMFIGLIVVGALVAVVVILHLAGVIGPGAH